MNVRLLLILNHGINLIAIIKLLVLKPPCFTAPVCLPDTKAALCVSAFLPRFCFFHMFENHSKNIPQWMREGRSWWEEQRKESGKILKKEVTSRREGPSRYSKCPASSAGRHWLRTKQFFLPIYWHEVSFFLKLKLMAPGQDKMV